MRDLLVFLALLLPAAARADDIGAALRDNRWADAASMAATSADPVAQKLVLYYRLLTPAAAHPAEIAAFMAENPTWPNAALLARRLNEALATEPDNHIAADLCTGQPVREVAALLRCADAEAQVGNAPDAAERARQAWVGGITDPAQEAAFLRQWGPSLTAADQWRRFDRLAWADSAGFGGPASRQIGRLDTALRPMAETRLALRRDDPGARIPTTGFAADPALMLETARYLRRAGLEDEAQKLWLAQGAAAERATTADRRPAFWAERELLARHRLRGADAAGAYALVTGAADLPAEQVIEADFLAGYIALRRLNDPAAAARHFASLGGRSHAIITQARAFYWLGRTADVRGDAAAAHDAYSVAATWPTTFYGQLAIRALGGDDAQMAARIRAVRDPVWTPERALSFASEDNARAAALLTAWGEPRRARAFILRLDEQAQDGTDRALAARMAQGFGLPDLAVAIARRAGRDGVVLAESGWPMAVSPPDGPVEPALTLGLIRQESNFNTEAASPAGARGLMQLMPATAQAVARKLGEAKLNPGALVTDPAYNMRLGTTYLAGLLDQFGGAMPYAIAGYNAGPSRVMDWLAVNGDPAVHGAVTMLDWIELIPFAETRNYVQRVIENIVVYRARTGANLPHPLARWLG